MPLDELLTADVGGNLEHLLAEVRRALLDQLLVVDREVWMRNGGKDAFVKQTLTQLFGDRDWDVIAINKQSALAYVRAVNDAVHTLARTTGASAYRTLVAKEQGGDYCTACGRRSGLHVDHIVPVSRGGAREDLKNMQLLCQSCNTGKRDLEGELLPSALVTRTTGEVPARLRYKRLLLTARREDGRDYGVCACGSTSRDEELIVTSPTPFAANILNLVVRCGRH